MSLTSAGKNGKNVFIIAKILSSVLLASALINLRSEPHKRREKREKRVHKCQKQCCQLASALMMNCDAVLTGIGLNKFVQHFAFL